MQTKAEYEVAKEQITGRLQVICAIVRLTTEMVTAHRQETARRKNIQLALESQKVDGTYAVL